LRLKISDGFIFWRGRLFCKDIDSFILHGIFHDSTFLLKNTESLKIFLLFLPVVNLDNIVILYWTRYGGNSIFPQLSFQPYRNEREILILFVWNYCLVWLHTM
jgi:hypothetical protein